jgi:hypothetical protein
LRQVILSVVAVTLQPCIVCGILRAERNLLHRHCSNEN